MANAWRPSGASLGRTGHASGLDALPHRSPCGTASVGSIIGLPGTGAMWLWARLKLRDTGLPGEEEEASFYSGGADATAALGRGAGTPTIRFRAPPTARPSPAPPTTSRGLWAPRYTRAIPIRATTSHGSIFHRPWR